jgi:hypothetical protein
MNYESERVIASASVEGATFRIARMSFGRRIELTRRIWELTKKVEFLDAGEDPREKLEAAVLRGEIDRVYLSWGLVGVEGLTIDGEAASAERLIEAGPEELSQEIVAAIKAECGLNEDERKN